MLFFCLVLNVSLLKIDSFKGCTVYLFYALFTVCCFLLEPLSSLLIFRLCISHHKILIPWLAEKAGNVHVVLNLYSLCIESASCTENCGNTDTYRDHGESFEYILPAPQTTGICSGFFIHLSSVFPCLSGLFTLIMAVNSPFRRHAIYLFQDQMKKVWAPTQYINPNLIWFALASE